MTIFEKIENKFPRTLRGKVRRKGSVEADCVNSMMMKQFDHVCGSSCMGNGKTSAQSGNMTSLPRRLQNDLFVVRFGGDIV